MKTLTKWRVLAPLSLAAAGAAALGVAALLKKLSPAEDAAKTAAPAKAAAPANRKTGSYSFISGYKDAATLDVTLDYDPDKYSFSVIEEDFPAYTSDSHVAVVRSPEFIVQLEYAGYYSGEDFAGLKKSLGERYENIEDVSFGANKAIQYVDGDNVCIAVPVDQYSYLLATLIKGKEYDDDFKTLPAYPPVKAVLDSLKFTNVG